MDSTLLWILGVLLALVLFGLWYTNHIMNDYYKNTKVSVPQKPEEDDEEDLSSLPYDEQFIRLAMKQYSAFKREDLESFLSVIHTFNDNQNKDKAFEEYDQLITRIVSSNNIIYAITVNGFFCEVLRSATSLTKSEVDQLVNKYDLMLKERLIRSPKETDLSKKENIPENQSLHSDKSSDSEIEEARALQPRRRRSERKDKGRPTKVCIKKTYSDSVCFCYEGLCNANIGNKGS